MKQIYVCEKCGKQFDNYADAYKCESSHAVPLFVYPDDLPEDSPLAQHLQEYKPGEVAPSIVTMRYPVLDENGYSVEDENGVQLYKVVRYAPVVGVKASKDKELIAQLKEAAHERDLEKKRENDAWLADYYARQEAKRNDNNNNNEEEEE